MRRLFMMFLALMFLIGLSGCLYPEDRKLENQIPYQAQIESVQSAVLTYQQNEGVLPIKTRDQTTPIYRKYPINFSTLVPRYLPEPPGNSFENGGVYQYVLINVETTPEVKLLDLEVTESIREVRLRLNHYIGQNGYPPVKEIVSDRRYKLDYEALGYKVAPTVTSRLTGEALPIMIDDNGVLFVDYRADLKALLEANAPNVQEGDDLRLLYTENSYFVPAYSVPYTIHDDEPVFLTK